MSYPASTEMAEPENTQGADLPVIRAVQHFDSFYRTEFEPVAGLAHALSGSRLAAEDLAQDGFMAAYRRWDEIGRYENPGAPEG